MNSFEQSHCILFFFTEQKGFVRDVIKSYKSANFLYVFLSKPCHNLEQNVVHMKTMKEGNNTYIVHKFWAVSIVELTCCRSRPCSSKKVECQIFKLTKIAIVVISGPFNRQNLSALHICEHKTKQDHFPFAKKCVFQGLSSCPAAYFHIRLNCVNVICIVNVEVLTTSLYYCHFLFLDSTHIKPAAAAFGWPAKTALF